MSRVPGKNTKPEVSIRSLLHELGYRFTVNGPKNRKLPGRPDIVLPKYKTSIFVHGCFWHGHATCNHSRTPKTRSEWWQTKVNNNRARDVRNFAALEDLGWNVIVLWTCEFNNRVKIEALAKTLPALIQNSASEESLLLVAEDPPEYGMVNAPPIP